MIKLLLSGLLAGHLFLQLLSYELVFFDGLSFLLLLVPLVDSRVALTSSDIGNFSILSCFQLLQALFLVGKFFVFSVNILVVFNSFTVLSFDPTVEVAVDTTLLLSNSFLVNNFTLHGQNEPFEGIKLRLGLHLAKLSLAFLVFLTIWECAVHGTLDILFDQRRRLRGLIISNPLLRLTMANNDALSAVATATFLLEGGVRVLVVRQQTPREV